MRTTEHRYRWNGDEIRVIVAGDVLALPYEGWSGENYGSSITEEWLLHEARLPGPAGRRRALARCLVMALDEHHGRPGREERSPEGPLAKRPCSACLGSGWRVVEAAPSAEAAP